MSGNVPQRVGARTPRMGHGYDLHRLEPVAPEGGGRRMVLGGVAIPSARGPLAHSDGDAVIHALVDAIFGAMASPDLGSRYPDTDAAHLGEDSTRYLHDAVREMRSAGYSLGNADITVVCESPKIAPYRQAIRANLSSVIGCPVECLNIKGKTHEGVDAIGEGRAIEVHAVVLLAPVG